MVRRDLAVACEFDERDGTRRCLTLGTQLFPELGIAMLDVAGGTAAFSGIGGALSEAMAVGLDRSVTAGDVDVITEFYRAHGVAARVLTSPISDPGLAPLLARAGYVPVEYRNTLLARVDDLEGEHDERIRDADDKRAWAHAAARNFGDGAEPDQESLTVCMLLAHGGADVLEGRVGDEIVSTGCYASNQSRIGLLFAAATAPAHRRQGWQRAMIRERIVRAQAAGMKHLRVTAQPLGDSERNFRALGFVPLYTRITWERSLS